ncbi:MAG TPA: MazG family protein [Candidatus Dormibacteraeota bacterium]|nr:MazG family protein [Candidatus Dormibacteraeota bacterium]
MTDDDLLQLRRLFEVMEQLRAPGGCPWDRAQTHQTLLPFLLEETYEAMQAAEESRPDELAEELGDLLVEVAMHCAIAAEAHTFDIGTVAKSATAKMIGRHPHVFGDLQVAGVAQVLSNWEELKRREKPDRESALDGIPDSLPALALAAAVQRRRPRGLPPDGPAGADFDPVASAQGALSKLAAGEEEGRSAQELVGELLYSVVALARARDVDAEGALRRYSSGRRAALRRGELDDRAKAAARASDDVN